MQREADGGQGGHRVHRERQVVEAGDGHVLRDAQAAVAQRRADPEGHGVVRGQNGRQLRVAAQQFQRAVVARGAVVRAVRRQPFRGLGQTGVGHGGAVAFEAVAGGRPGGRSGEVAEAAVAEGQQVVGQAPGAAPVVERQGQRVRAVGVGGQRRPSAQDDLGARGVEPAQPGGERFSVRRVLHRSAGEHDGRGALALEEREIRQLALRGAAGVADDGQLARRVTELGLHRAGHDPEERVGDVVDEHADEVGRGGGQGARRAVDHVLQLLDGAQHAVPRGARHRIVAVENTGHRRRGHPRAGRDVRQRD